MRVSMHLGGESKFELRHAVLLYGDGSQSFATVHDPIENPRGKGAPILGPAQPLGAQFLKTISQEMGESLPTEILPSTVLVRTPTLTVWWRPRSVAACFYKVAARPPAEMKRFAALSGQRVPHPALVFMASANSLAVRALAKNERPTSTTPLFAAPYYNVGKEGAVCVGTMTRPRSRGLDSLSVWEDAFFGSAFTHPLPGAAMLSRSAGTYLNFWSSMAKRTGKSATFPTSALVTAPNKQTLADFVGSETGRSW